MLEGFKSKLIGLLGGVPTYKEELYNVRMPSEKELRDVVKKELAKAFQAQLAQLQAENILLKKNLERGDVLEEENKKYKEILIKAKIHEKEKKKQDAHKKITFLLDKENLPKVSLKSQATNRTLRAYQYLAGFQLQEYDNGEFEFRPVLTDKDKKDRVLLTKGSLDFRQMFNNAQHIPSQLNNGAFNSNFDLTSKGKLILHSDYFISDETGKKVRLVHLSGVERQGYVEKIDRLHSQLNGMQSMVMETNGREEELNNKLREQAIRINKLVSRTSNYKKLSSIATEKEKSAQEQLGTVLLSSQDAITNQQLTEQFLLNLKTRFGEVMSKYAKSLSEDKREQIRNELFNEIMRIKSTIKESPQGLKEQDHKEIAKKVAELNKAKAKGAKK